MELTLELLQERIENNTDQTNRLLSHVQSEQRVSGNHEKRIDGTEKDITRLQRQSDKYDNLLFNSGKGLSFRVDRLEQAKTNSNATINTILSVASLLISLAMAILMYFK